MPNYLTRIAAAGSPSGGSATLNARTDARASDGRQ